MNLSIFTKDSHAAESGSLDVEHANPLDELAELSRSASDPIRVIMGLLRPNLYLLYGQLLAVDIGGKRLSHLSCSRLANSRWLCLAPVPIVIPAGEEMLSTAPLPAARASCKHFFAHA